MNIEINIDATIDAHNPDINTPGANKNAIYTTNPLITKLNNPKDISVIGKEKKCSIGFSVIFKTPKNIETASSPCNVLTLIPSNIKDVRYIDIDGEIIIKSNLLSKKTPPFL